MKNIYRICSFFHTHTQKTVQKSLTIENFERIQCVHHPDSIVYGLVDIPFSKDKIWFRKHYR